jgi:hypothetical protein
MGTEILKIGVFYDGNYFLHVSNYYNYFHAMHQRLSLPAFHGFIRHLVAESEGISVRYSRIIGAHYFRGRLSAQEASQRGNQLYNDRVFDDILMSVGIVSHFLPLRTRSGKKEEKGIDVWLALEAYEQTLIKKFDVLVLITSDGEYVPLVRKLNSLGVKTMVLNWEFAYVDDSGREIVTRTAQDLLQEVTYPVAAHVLIDQGLEEGLDYVNDLFVTTEPALGTPRLQDTVAPEQPAIVLDGNLEAWEDEYGEQHYRGQIMNLNPSKGYGFIKYPPNNLFFYRQDLENVDISQLQVGDTLEFQIALNEDGDQVAKHLRYIEH